MKNLTELSLTGNLIADLPCGAFHDFTFLRWIELDKNRIRHISSGVFDKLENLVRLKLDDNPIESIEANAFSQLNNLIELSLNSCRLKSIDSEMFNGLHYLNELSLSNNLIERIEVAADDGRRINVAKANLSNEEKELIKRHLFKDLSRLYHLRLHGNKLEKLDLNCFSNLKFAHYLYLSSNKINELGGVAEPELLSILKTIHLDNNQLTAINESAFPKSFQELNLAKNHLKRLDNDFFAKFAQLRSVDLSENKLKMTITEETFASCSDSLGRIDLSLNESIRVTEEAIREMPVLRDFECDFSAHFTDLSELETLRIRRLTPEIVRALKEFSRDEQNYAGRLNTCNLSGCSIKTLTRKSDWKEECVLVSADLDQFNLSWLAKAWRLKELNFTGNLIETLDDPELFADSQTIYEINLSHNRLTRIHRDIFKCLPCLETINLSGNSLSSIDMGLFRELKHLKHLNLSSNCISSLNLARLFRFCQRLESLNVADNQLDDRSTEEPIDARLSVNLKRLSLASNRLGKMDFVRDMTALKHLDLGSNQIESVMSKEGENLLGRLRELTHLDLSDNKISPLKDEIFSHLHGQLEQLDISGNPLDSFQLDSVLRELI